MLVSIEGLSASGKSTIRNLLAQQANFKVIPTVPPEYTEARALVDNGKSLNARYLLYLSGVCYQAEQIRKEVQNPNIHVLVESYVYRTLSFYPTLGSKISIGIKDLDIIVPDMVFFLEVDEHIRNLRMKYRNKHKHTWDEMNNSKSELMKNNYLSLSKYIIINNSTDQPQKTVDSILHKLPL